nr:hypothetical protein [Lachnospiraceae bacterium]
MGIKGANQVKKTGYNDHFISRQSLLAWVVLFILFSSLLSGLAGKETIIHSLLFFLFEILVILIPGLFFASFRTKKGSEAEGLLLSYMLGYSASIVLFFLLMVLHVPESGIRIITLFYAALMIFGCLRRRNRLPVLTDEKNSRSERLLILGLFIVLFLAKLLLYELSELPPVYAQVSYLHHDSMYWVSDVTACMKKLPAFNIRSMRDHYDYHYLAAAQIAYFAKCAGVSAVNAAVVYAYIQPVILMALSAACVVFRLVRTFPARLFTLAALFFSTGKEVSTVVTYRVHILLLPMAFDISYGMFIGIFWFLLSVMDDEGISFCDNLLISFFIAVLTGMKGPMGALALGMAGLFYLYMLYRNRRLAECFRNGFMALAFFVFIYAFMLSGALNRYLIRTPVSQEQTGTVTTETENAQEGGEQHSPENAGNMENPLMKAVYSLRYYLRYLKDLCPVILLLDLVFAVYWMIRRRKPDFLQGMMFFFLLFGSALGYFIKMNGSSQMYFSMCAMFFAFVIAGELTDEYCLFVKRPAAQSAVYVLLLFLLITTARTDLDDQTYLAFQNAKRLLSKDSAEYQGIFTDDYRVTEKEFGSFLWLRTNTEDDAMLLSDLGFFDNGINRNDLNNDLIPALAERRSFYYYSKKNQELVRDILEGRGELADLNRKIDYVLLH